MACDADHLVEVLQALQIELVLNKEHNKGAAFKGNTDTHWRGTMAIRCNHVHIDKVPELIKTVIHMLQYSRRIVWWEHTSVARCFKYQRINGQKHNDPNKKTVYFTLRLPKPLMADIRARWPEATFRNLHLLVDWLEKGVCDDE